MRRFRGSNRSLFLKIAIAVSAISLVSLAASGAFASSQHRTIPGDKISDCLQTLKGFKEALADVQNLLSRKGENAVILFTGRDGYTTYVSVRQATDFFTLQYLAGELTLAEYKAALAYVGRKLVASRRHLRDILGNLEDILNRTQKRCNALKGQAQPKPKPKPQPPTQAGSFTLVGVTKDDVKNPNAVELTIDAPAMKATDDHPASLGGGQWLVEFTWKLPQTLTPGKTSSVTLGIKVESNPGQNTFGLIVLAPGLAQQLLGKDSVTQMYEFTVPVGNKDAKDLTITIRVLSAEVIYHYRRG